MSEPRSALAAITALQGLGARAVLASLGERGAVLVDETGAHHAQAPVAHPRSTVGAGDATLAGFLSAGASGPTPCARRRLRHGGRPASRTQMPHPGDTDESAVALTTLTPAQPSPAAAERSLS